MQLDVLYFAWVRERIGIPRESVETQAVDINALIEELRGREERYAAAFADTSAIRAAINQKLVPLDTPLDGAREVAFFPPMTGG